METNRLAGAEGMLSLTTPALVAALVEWVLDELDAQLRGRDARPWSGPLD